jgi:pimeloyl-ACP methyl ester carboxylesterase
MGRIAGDIYGGRMRNSPDLVQKHMRHVRGSSDYGYYLQLMAFVGWTSLPWLPFLPQPTLVMAGSDDPIVPLVNGRIMAKLIPDSQMVTLDDGHLFLLTSAQESARLITEFLGKN